MEEIGEEIGGWGIERVIAEGDVHQYAVTKAGAQAVMHVVAPGASSTLLHAATVGRTLVVRGKHEGRAFVVTTDARPIAKRRSSVPLLVLVFALVGGGLAIATLVRAKGRPACADCVLIVDGVAVPAAAFRMYVGDPYVLADKKGDAKKRAALDLLIVRSVLYADATKRGIEVTDVAERARAGQFSLGLATFDVRAKLAADGETFEDATIDRYAKAVGLVDRAALFEEMRIERMAIEAGGDRRAACARAKVVVVKLLDPPYRPCSTL